MATRNNGKSIKMFYLSTDLPGKYQRLAPSLGRDVARPSWICYVDPVQLLILMSSLASFTHLHSASRVTAVLHHFNCAMKYFITESAGALPSSSSTMRAVDRGGNADGHSGISFF